MKRLKKVLPKEYHPFEGITEIRYGFMGRKIITVKEIKEFSDNKNTMGSQEWYDNAKKQLTKKEKRRKNYR